MRLIVLSSLVLTVLFAATGCGVSSSRAAASPVGAAVATSDTPSDASWTPPGELSFSMNEAKPARTVTFAAALPKPNRKEIARGQVHAAY